MSFLTQFLANTKTGILHFYQNQACFGSFAMTKDVTSLDIICPLRGPSNSREFGGGGSFKYEEKDWRLFAGEPHEDRLTFEEVRSYINLINKFGIKIEIIQEEDNSVAINTKIQHHPFVVCRVYVDKDIMNTNGTIVAYACNMVRHIYEHGAVVRSLLENYDESIPFIVNYCRAMNAPAWRGQYQPAHGSMMHGHSCFPWKAYFKLAQVELLDWDYVDVIDYLNRFPAYINGSKYSQDISRKLSEEQLSYRT